MIILEQCDLIQRQEQRALEKLSLEQQGIDHKGYKQRSFLRQCFILSIEFDFPILAVLHSSRKNFFHSYPENVQK